MKYAIRAKTKFKIHSPFVFSFITNILEKEVTNELAVKLRNFYSKNYTKVDNTENKGAGSVFFDAKIHNINTYLKRTAIPEKYGKILQELAHTKGQSNILELGTSLGISASYLAANPSNTVHTIEGNETIYKLTKNAFETLELKNVVLYQSSFEEGLEKIAAKIQPISLVFIDGNHKKDATINYFNQLLPYTTEETIVILDDIYWSEEMTAAWNEIRKHENVRLSINLYRMGILFFKRERKQKEDFTLWY